MCRRSSPGELDFAEDRPEIEEDLEVEDVLGLGRPEPFGEVRLPGPEGLAPARIVGHDLPQAEGIAGQGQAVGDELAHLQEIGLDGGFRLRRDVLEDDGVVLVGGQGLLLAPLAAQGHESEAGRGRSELRRGELEEPEDDRVGHGGHGPGDVAGLGSALDQDLHEPRQSAPRGGDGLGRGGVPDLLGQDGQRVPVEEQQIAVADDAGHPAVLVADEEMVDVLLAHGQDGFVDQGVGLDRDERGAHDRVERAIRRRDRRPPGGPGCRGRSPGRPARRRP